TSDDDKVHVIGVDTFIGKKVEDSFLSTQVVDVPNHLLDIHEGIRECILELVDTSGTVIDDIRVPASELDRQLKTAFEEGRDLLVTVIYSMDENRVIPFEISPTPLKI
ncbi:Eukaryotic translation initiation factor 5A, partial [Haplosporangium gracile]